MLPTDTWSPLLAARTPHPLLFILPHAVLILSKCGPRGPTFSSVHICLSMPGHACPLVQALPPRGVL